MDEYIKREALMVALCKEITGEGDYYNGKDDMQDQIRDMVSQFPAADVAPVRHGRWITTSGEFFPGSNQFLCYSHKHEECGFQYVDMNENAYDYCPNCGCIMDLED